MSLTPNQAELSATTMAIVSALSATAVLVLRIIATILTRITSGEKGPFRGASIEWGSYRIRVSRHRRSVSTPSKARRMAAPGSGSTAAPRRKAAYSYSARSELLSPPSSGEDAKSSSFSDEAVLADRGQGQQP